MTYPVFLSAACLLLIQIIFILPLQIVFFLHSQLVQVTPDLGLLGNLVWDPQPVVPVAELHHHFVLSYCMVPCSREYHGSHFYVIRLGLSFCHTAAQILVFRLHLWFLMCLKDAGVWSTEAGDEITGHCPRHLLTVDRHHYESIYALKKGQKLCFLWYFSNSNWYVIQSLHSVST